jgi:(1->4)-alpha-D-glucan 1-alpha-D-glucosylmutase
VIAYLRGDSVLTVVPRWSHAAAPWGETALALPNKDRWRNRLTGAEVAGGRAPLAGLLGEFPVALLERIQA